MATPRQSILTAGLRLDVQEFYSRYAECLEGGRLIHWPEFFTDACVYRVTTRRNYRLRLEEDLITLTGITALRDHIAAVGRSEDFEPHLQRLYIGNFRIQASSDEELHVQANFQVLRTFPERRTELFVSGSYLDRITVIRRRPYISEKLCLLDSDVPPDSLDLPI